jgi:protein SDA1
VRATASERIDGVDLLQRDILKRKREEEATEASDEDEDDFVVDDDDDEDDNEDEDDESGEEEFSEEDEEEEEDDERATGKRGREEDEEEEDVDPDAPAPKRRKNGKLSLAELKRRHKALVQKRKAEEEAELRAEEEAEEAELGGPVEQERILTDDDFKRIKALKTEQQLNAALSKAGASKATNVAGDAIRLMMRRADRASDRRVNPASLEATGLRKAHDKATRLASVLAGREENEYGACDLRASRRRLVVRATRRNSRRSLFRSRLACTRLLADATRPCKRASNNVVGTRGSLVAKTISHHCSVCVCVSNINVSIQIISFSPCTA